ncbi:hypothetical protein AB0J86_07400 [Micromonospora sp. NPDC049559]|uniref:hypothetical protein n=1 Tax=Micromonospora sp. NPDC049559 TaxID=3155923 RepID=UPI00344A3AB4
MSTTREPDALLLGGPRDGLLFTAEDAAIVQLEVDGLMQRYLRTSNREERNGIPLVVFVYDGAGAPEGGEPAVGAR